MKAIKCEMCESTDVVKDGDFYVCQSCGAKYTVDAAKKLIVDVGEQDSVKLKNLYQRARQCLEVDDLEHAAEYFKQILDEKPDDWEAYFYSYLGETTSFTNAQAAAVAHKLGNTIPAAYDLAIANCDPLEAGARVKTISETTSNRILGIASTAYNLLSQHEGGSMLTPAGSVNRSMYNNLRPTAVNTICACTDACDELDKKLNDICARETGIETACLNESRLMVRRARYSIANHTYRPTALMTEKLIKPEYIEQYAAAIKDLDPSFDEPSNDQQPQKTGCYVATCVYGSYDCPQVWTLRRYRDDTLGASWYGRAFIRLYYAVSPTLVKWFGKTSWFKKLWKGKLDRMVRKLNARGVENTPYKDKRW